MKLYKFRSLGDPQSFERAATLLETGKFWCSPLWEQNDPMEGVYSYKDSSNINSELADVFSRKNHFKICSFSGESALNNPIMWGYYTNGFRGIAIEIKVRRDAVRKIQYSSNPYPWRDDPKILKDQKIEGILTTKLDSWKAEEEYRYLTKKAAGYRKIGVITGVYFGRPYGNIGNAPDVIKESAVVSSLLKNGGFSIH